MTTQTSRPASIYQKELNGPEDLTENCALKIVQHLERHIVLHRNDSEKANRLASMNKYIQVMYLSALKVGSGY